MGMIDIYRIINELPDELIEKLSRDARPYLTFYYVDDEKISREMLIEKIGQYLELFERKNNLRDNSLAGKFVSELFPYLYYRIENASRAISYYSRVQNIKKEIESCDDVQKTNKLLEDFSKIFLCLYDQFLKNDCKPVIDFDFFIEAIDFQHLSEYLKTDTPQRIKLPDIPLEPVKIVFKGTDQPSDEAQKLKEDTDKKPVRLFGKKKDIPTEPIRERIEYADKSGIYSLKNYAILILTVYYYSLYAFETGGRREG